ncbi:MAG TPA: ATP-binding protein [Polyangiaceae bacterium]|jgi:signal transduction histidine kinase/ActR/RegA family two-component response regulator|nr:ATP-binding protein [Polyangiaceae bacterium]
MESAAAGSLFPGGGVAGALVRTLDWTRTSLGSVGEWPIALVSQVRTMLATRQPMCLFWGPELVNLYNDGFLPILGEKHPAAMGQPAEECWREAWAIVGAQLLRAKQGECVFNEEVLVPIARGGVVADAWWNYSYSPLFDDDGRENGVLVICTEVTNEVVGRRRVEESRREAEGAREELHGIFMQAPAPMCILNGPEHRFTLANRPFLDFVQRAVVGKTVTEAFTVDEVGYYLPILDRVFSTGEPVVLHEAPLELSDGSDLRTIDVVYHPHRDPQGDLAGVLVMIHDVTPQVAARKQIEALAVQQSAARKQADGLREQAEAASRAKDDFLATVSHELRTPLNAILGWSTILLQPGGHDRVDKGIPVIERNARAQAKIIDDILDVSRIISGKLLLGPKPIDVAVIIDAAVDAVRPAAAAKRVQLRVETSVSAPWVADEDRIQQIVWNLLSNAVKFTPAGGTVSVRAIDEGNELRIQVADTGRGITPSFLPYVFDRFRQGDASTTRYHGGLGLGLAIVRHLVELHGGVVTAESDGEGQGALFEVRLPRRAMETFASPADDVALGDIVESVSEKGSSLEGVSVLVIDDERDARELAAIVLEDAGATVVQAGDVATALRLLTEMQPAAIVSDIGMPSEDGYSFLGRVRADSNSKSIPAVALTAFARAEDRQRALAAGFQRHLAKPIDPAKLVAAVAALIGDSSEEKR